MKEELLKGAELRNREIEAKKIAFRQHQRNLSFSEKMQVAFALAERDKNIHRAILLLKRKEED